MSAASLFAFSARFGPFDHNSNTAVFLKREDPSSVILMMSPDFRSLFVSTQYLVQQALPNAKHPGADDRKAGNAQGIGQEIVTAA